MSAVAGMTCGHCKATYTGGIAVQDLVDTVEATGYTAREPPPPERATEPVDGADKLRPLRQRLITAVVMAVSVVAMVMVPALQFD
jgi:Cu+-exporting ATPase